MSREAYLPFMKMMVQGFMTSLIEICDKLSPRYEKIRGDQNRCLLVDKENVAERKRLYAEAGSRSETGKLITKLEDASFILPNNVVSSALFNATKAIPPIFTMNLRGFCPEFSKDMTGNCNKFMILYPLIYKPLYLI